MAKEKVHLKNVTLSNGEQLAYREREGGKNNVILVHGNMTSSVHWDVVIEALSAEFKVYAVDLRGFGKSSYHEPIETIKDFSDDLKLFVDEIGLTDFSLVGWSLGGAVCMQFCADYPNYVKTLFLLASGSTRGYPYFTTGEDGLPDVTKRLRTLDETMADSKRIMIQGAYDTKNYDLLRQVWDMAIYTQKKPEEDQYQAYLEDMTTQRNLAECYHALNIFNISPVHNGLTDGEDRVKDIEVPVLNAYGEHDLVVTRQMTEEIMEDFGDRAENYLLEGCGHSPLIDDLDQLIDVMERFLAD